MSTRVKCNICLLCGSVGKLNKCSRCKLAHYCSKDHQKKHWKFHKYDCVKDSKKIGDSASSVQEVNERISNSKFKNGVASSNKLSDQQLDDSSNNELGEMENKSPVFFIDSKPLMNIDDTFCFESVNIKSDMQSSSSILKKFSHQWFNSICDILIKDMNSHGICVIDNFLGPSKGEACLEDVNKLYGSGLFEAGQVIKRTVQVSENVRGDFITWVNGSEPECRNISILIRALDAVIKQVNTQPNSGKLKDYNLSNRTKAMISCYPGSGTHYVKHVDNPNDDGRCLTCIYYLNKDWNTLEDGGLLRVYPSHENTVANIEPKFDRLIFFWSDRRNPHEVQPAFKRRFAITVWYLDSHEWENRGSVI